MKRKMEKNAKESIRQRTRGILSKKSWKHNYPPSIMSKDVKLKWETKLGELLQFISAL